MKKVDSAGGVVVRSRGEQPEILLIRHTDFDDWFLPKGHVEAGEDFETTALREVAEETGLTDVEIIQALGHFTRVTAREQELKTEHHFLFRKNGQQPVALEDGQPWEARWFTHDELPKFYIEGQERLVRHNWPAIDKLVSTE